MYKYKKLKNTIINDSGSDEDHPEEKLGSTTDIQMNEVRVTHRGKARNYVAYIHSLFRNQQVRKITLKGIGKAIGTEVLVAEIVKRKIAALHQINELRSIDVVETYEPLEEGLDTLEITRSLACMCITLSLDPLDTGHYGYQPPQAVFPRQPRNSTRKKPVRAKMQHQHEEPVEEEGSSEELSASDNQEHEHDDDEDEEPKEPEEPEESPEEASEEIENSMEKLEVTDEEPEGPEIIPEEVPVAKRPSSKVIDRRTSSRKASTIEEKPRGRRANAPERLASRKKK